LEQEDMPMSRSVDLPDSVYAALEEAAASSGTTPAGWIAAQLLQPVPAHNPESEGPPPSTLAERFASVIGGFRSGRNNPAERYDGIFADADEIPDTRAVGGHPRMIEVSEDVYRDLEEEALAVGTTPEEWIAARLPLRSPASESDGGAQPPRTLADEFAGRVGLFSSGQSDLSERVSELFAEGMLEKRRTGTL
jgi:hypothetical protein